MKTELEKKESLYATSFDPTYERHKIYSLAEWINGRAFKQEDYSFEGLLILRIAEVKNGVNASTHFTGAEYDDKFRICSGDILFCWSGQPETSIGSWIWHGSEGWLNQHIFKVLPKCELVDEKFFFYLLQYLKPTFVKLAGHKQTTGLGHVTKQDLQRLEVGLASKKDQKAIAHILGTLDDKIELNRKMNETLESIAQTLFKSRFIDFDPVKAKAEGRKPEGMSEEIAALFPDSFEDSELGRIPRGWEIHSIYSHAKFVNGAVFKTSDFSKESDSLPIIKIAELKNGISNQTRYTTKILEEKYKIKNGDLLFSWSGNLDTSIDIFIWAEGPAWLNQHIFKVESVKLFERSYLYYLLKYLKSIFTEIARNKQTTGLGHVKIEDMKKLMVVEPSEKVLAFFNLQTSPLFKKKMLNFIITQELINIRNTLLPKLISGEIRVKDAEKLVADIS